MLLAKAMREKLESMGWPRGAGCRGRGASDLQIIAEGEPLPAPPALPYGESQAEEAEDEDDAFGESTTLAQESF